jgi:probable H4MPT-linked C1 transfer pathway protein
LWQGLEHLARCVDNALARWPQLGAARHAVTMTGEMVDLFAHREAGVAAIAAQLGRLLGGRVAFFAAGRGWIEHAEAPAAWRHIASANWVATAAWIARRFSDALLIDIGSTTTDIVPIEHGQVAARGSDDAGRLASGELVYQGVVRTPLAVLAARVPFAGREYNVMNEFFATSADVYRLTGELAEEHDQHAAADNGPKDAAGSRRRLARLIGHDARDASDADWLEFARTWRNVQLAEIRGNAERVAASLPASAPIVAAGCGDFLVRDLAARMRRPCVAFETLADVVDAPTAHWARVCAPAVAVALLRASDLRPVLACQEGRQGAKPGVSSLAGEHEGPPSPRSRSSGFS